ncbi:MAG: sulfurtransferase [Thermoanaerobaculia bacterium]
MYSRRTILFSVITICLIAVPLAAHQRDMIVSTEWLGRNLSARNVVVLHVGMDRKSYDAGHIPGARFVAVKEIATGRGDVLNELPPVETLVSVFERLGVANRSRIVLYGDMQGLTAARAWFTLDYLGHGERVALLDGGLEKWKAESRPLSTDDVTPVPAMFLPKLNPDVSVELQKAKDLSWQAVHVSSPQTVLVDARPRPQFVGTEPGEGVKRGGHIPGAKHLFWMDHVISKENPTLKSEAELRKMYEGIGAAKGKRIVTYCRTGVQASHSYFIAKYLGYDTAMYDGSFIEWSNAEGTEVVTVGGDL